MPTNSAQAHTKSQHSMTTSQHHPKPQGTTPPFPAIKMKKTYSIPFHKKGHTQSLNPTKLYSQLAMGPGTSQEGQHEVVEAKLKRQ